MNKLSLVVSIYRNEANILPFYEEFKKNIKPYLDDYEIVMVNDDSPDGSWNIMKQLAQEDKKIKLIKHSRNFGAVAASYTGLQYASGDCVTVKSVDLQEPSELTIDMYRAWKEGAKSVIAVRESREDSFSSKLFSSFYYWLVRKMVNPRMPKGGFDTYLLDRTIVDHIIKNNDKNAPITLQILWLGYHFTEIKYRRKKREIGKSSWTFGKKVTLFLDTFIGFSYIPIRIMTMVGIIFALLSLLWGGRLVIAGFRNEISVRGYTTIVVLILFSSGLIMFTLGLLGEYIWRTLDASRHRPISVIEETINLDRDA